MKPIPFSPLVVTFGIFTSTLMLLPIACNSSDAPPSDYYRPVGAACAFSWQCASGACNADEARGTCGVCIDVRRLGESCDGPLMTCTWSAVCNNGTCQSTKKTTGESCEMEAKGGSDDCDADFYCDGTAGGMGVCKAKPDFGDACTTGFPGCARGPCERGVCVPPREGAIGDSCDDSPCRENLACHGYLDGRFCEEPNLVPVNGSCNWWEPNLDCVKGTSCEGTGEPEVSPGHHPATCVPGKTEGEDCTSHHCADGLNCRHVNGTDFTYTCQRLRVAGESCVFHDDCSAGLECRNDLCQAACQ